MNASTPHFSVGRVIAFCIFIAVVIVVDIFAVQANADFQAYAWTLITSVLQAGYLLLAWYFSHFFSGN